MFHTYTTPAKVEVEHLDSHGEHHTMIGYLHTDQSYRGPSLVLNPDAFDLAYACCWMVPWSKVLRISVLEAGERDLSIPDSTLPEPIETWIIRYSWRGEGHRTLPFEATRTQAENLLAEAHRKFASASLRRVPNAA